MTILDNFLNIKNSRILNSSWVKNFTPLESPAACSGDEEINSLLSDTGLMPRVSPVGKSKPF